MSGIKSRQCALNSLMGVFDGKKPLDQLLDKNATKLGLSAQDKSFAHALCGFVLRYKPALQKQINIAANRQSDITPSPLNILLLMGAAQIYLMNVPDHAAVNSSVELTYKIKCSKQKGFVNAVLRRLLREGQKSIKPSFPEWLFKKIAADYGFDLACNIEMSSLKEARIGITNTNNEWCETSDMPELSQDQWVQDFSSHFPVSLLNNIEGKVALDLCAAPGGKTMQLASKGANVVSVDISEKRLRLLKDNLMRTQMQDRVNVICADLLKWEPTEQADIIILDVPCSATGTIRRHPDLPYVREDLDIVDLMILQAQLLERVKNWLKPDGILVYCTCSLQKDEGENQINQFLKFHNEFERKVVKVTDDRYLTLDGDIRILPTYGEMDGFFVSYLGFKP